MKELHSSPIGLEEVFSRSENPHKRLQEEVSLLTYDISHAEEYPDTIARGISRQESMTQTSKNSAFQRSARVALVWYYLSPPSIFLVR